MGKLSSAIKPKYITITLHVMIWGAVLVLPFLLIPPDEQFGQIGPVRCNFFTLTNVMHIGLFYFNAFFLYAYLMTGSRWWIYLLTLALLIIVFYYIKLWILNTWFPVLATREETFRFTFFPTVSFLAIGTIYRLVSDKID